MPPLPHQSTCARWLIKRLFSYVGLKAGEVFLSPNNSCSLCQSQGRENTALQAVLLCWCSADLCNPQASLSPCPGPWVGTKSWDRSSKAFRGRAALCQQGQSLPRTRALGGAALPALSCPSQVRGSQDLPSTSKTGWSPSPESLLTWQTAAVPDWGTDAPLQSLWHLKAEPSRPRTNLAPSTTQAATALINKIRMLKSWKPLIYADKRPAYIS